MTNQSWCDPDTEAGVQKKKKKKKSSIFLLWSETWLSDSWFTCASHTNNYTHTRTKSYRDYLRFPFFAPKSNSNRFSISKNVLSVGHCTTWWFWSRDVISFHERTPLTHESNEDWQYIYNCNVWLGRPSKDTFWSVITTALTESHRVWVKWSGLLRTYICKSRRSPVSYPVRHL